jgi:hypothetical protein
MRCRLIRSRCVGEVAWSCGLYSFGRVLARYFRRKRGHVRLRHILSPECPRLNCVVSKPLFSSPTRPARIFTGRPPVHRTEQEPVHADSPRPLNQKEKHLDDEDCTILYRTKITLIPHRAHPEHASYRPTNAPRWYPEHLTISSPEIVDTNGDRPAEQQPRSRKHQRNLLLDLHTTHRISEQNLARSLIAPQIFW